MDKISLVEVKQDPGRLGYYVRTQNGRNGWVPFTGLNLFATTAFAPELVEDSTRDTLWSIFEDEEDVTHRAHRVSEAALMDLSTYISLVDGHGPKGQNFWRLVTASDFFWRFTFADWWYLYKDQPTGVRDTNLRHLFGLPIMSVIERDRGLVVEAPLWRGTLKIENFRANTAEVCMEDIYGVPTRTRLLFGASQEDNLRLITNLVKVYQPRS